MKKLAIAALALLPLVGGCYGGYYVRGYYRPSYVRVYGPSVYAPPAPVYVRPAPSRVYVGGYYRY
jgi:hypothetical protein